MLCFPGVILAFILLDLVRLSVDPDTNPPTSFFRPFARHVLSHLRGPLFFLHSPSQKQHSHPPFLEQTLQPSSPIADERHQANTHPDLPMSGESRTSSHVPLSSTQYLLTGPHIQFGDADSPPISKTALSKARPRRASRWLPSPSYPPQPPGIPPP